MSRNTLLNSPNSKDKMKIKNSARDICILCDQKEKTGYLKNKEPHGHWTPCQQTWILEVSDVIMNEKFFILGFCTQPP